MIKTIKAKAIVKVSTEMGYWCLAEIRGLKEGTVLEGRYNPINKLFFSAVKTQCYGLDRMES